MPRLDVYVDYQRFLSFKLTSNGLRIGRSGNCDIQLLSDAVSRYHSNITQTATGGFAVEDLSSNGTRVNSEMVHGRKVLANGDRIYIENYILVFQSDETPDQPLDTAHTLIMDGAHIM